jgi:hypothetical protein
MPPLIIFFLKFHTPTQISPMRAKRAPRSPLTSSSIFHFSPIFIHFLNFIHFVLPRRVHLKGDFPHEGHEAGGWLSVYGTLLRLRWFISERRMVPWVPYNPDFYLPGVPVACFQVVGDTQEPVFNIRGVPGNLCSRGRRRRWQSWPAYEPAAGAGSCRMLILYLLAV